jgi:hypothetical protein
MTAIGTSPDHQNGRSNDFGLYAFSIFDQFAAYGSFMGQAPHWTWAIQDLAFRARCASFTGFVRGKQTGV